MTHQSWGLSRSRSTQTRLALPRCARFRRTVAYRAFAGFHWLGLPSVIGA